MRLKLFLAATAAVALAVGAAAPASAVTMVATFKGKIDAVYTADLTFGTSSLLGLAYTARYTYDTTLGADSTYIPLPGYFDTIRGGGSAAASPVRSVAVTINGHTDIFNYATAILGESFIERINNPNIPKP